MSTDTKVPTGFVTALQGARKGIESNWPANTPAMRINKKDYTQAALQTEFDNLITTFTLPGSLAAQHADAVKVRDDAYPDAHDFVMAFFQALPAYVGSTAAGLAPFGKAPPKERPTPTAEQQAITNQKKKATRKARGTMGKKQKSEIHGTVPPTITIPTTPPILTPPKTGA